MRAMFRWLRSGQAERSTFSLWLGVTVGVVLGALIAAFVLWTDGDGGSDATVPAPSASAGAPTTSTTSANPVPASGTAPATSEVPTTSTPSTTLTTTTTTQPVDAVEARIDAMTLEQKIGQMFVVEVFGRFADAADARNDAAFGVATPREVVLRYGVGGVIYFADNVSDPVDPQQVATLSKGLQAAAVDGPGIGLLIAADQEGGRVTRIREPATVFPPALTFGQIGDTELARDAAEATAEELLAMGINQVYAPVADVVTEPDNQVIGDRSYGSDPELVAALTAAAVEGFVAGGVAPTAKHWPGHGNTATDSHLELAVIDVDRAGWEDVDRRPFAAAIGAGVSAVMVGHIEIADVGGPGPATLSRAMIETELRDRLEFDGLVITDSLRMGGVRDSGPDPAIAVQAVQAGVDILLLPFDFRAARQALIDAVRGGEIPEERIDESVRRILRLKERLGVLVPPDVNVDAAAGVVGSDEHRRINEDIRAQAP